MLWRLIYTASRVLRGFPQPARRSLAIALLGTCRFGSTRLHYGARSIAVSALAAHAGQRLIIGPGVYIIGPERLSLGDGVSINHFTYIDASGGIEIGSGTRIGNHSTLASGNHNIDGEGVTRSPIRIGEGVWIGAGARVLAGLSLGRDAVVGAGAVVTRDVVAGVTVLGVPARPAVERSLRAAVNHPRADGDTGGLIYEDE